MTQPNIIQTILKDSNYHLALFSVDEIKALRKEVFIKTTRGSEKFSDDDFDLYSLNKGDLLICRTNGNPKLVGKSALVAKDYPYVYEAHLFKIRPDANLINSETLAVYLNTSHGKSEIEKFSMQGNQANFSLAKFKEIRVPRFSIEFNSFIENIVNFSFSTLSESEYSYQQAQTALLTELGLNDWQPRHQLTFIKNYSDTEQAERFDAEYFQPKYEEIEQAIKQYSGGYSTIGEEFTQNKSTFKIDDKRTYQYVEIGSVNVSNGEISANEVIGEELPANAKRSLKKNDVIVSKVRTYRGAITIVEESGYIGSGAFTVLRENGRINKETLLAFLHSKPLLAWSLKPNTGTSYPVIIDDDILNLPMPLLPEAKQAEIQQKITESFNLRKQSKHLLESAKKAVEMAIEQDEQTAIHWLKNETKETRI